MQINATRLQQHFEATSLIGKIGETGTCRPTMTVLEKFEHLMFLPLKNAIRLQAVPGGRNLRETYTRQHSKQQKGE